MKDRIHQPYRAEICPLLPRCCPWRDSTAFWASALSGAGPAVLVIVDGEATGCRLPPKRFCDAMDGLPEPKLLNLPF